MTLHSAPMDPNLSQIIKLAVLAVGGQGGGVLTGWIEEVARAHGYAAQATSVAGVSQRTGATVYYVEMAPASGGVPIFSLMPAAGDVDIMIDTVTFTAAQIKGGRIRALAVTNPAPWPALPGVPTVAETVPGYEVRSWTGLAAPKGTPADIVDRLNAEARRALALPEIKSRFEELGNEVRPTSSNELKIHVATEIAKWKRVVEQAKIERQ